MGFWRDLFTSHRASEPVEARAIDAVPWAIGGPVGAAPLTQDRALALAPVFASVRAIAGTISTLPLKAYRQAGAERLPARLPQLFLDLSTDGRLVPWMHQAVASLALRGNTIGLITARDTFGYPTRIDWLNPSDVFVDDVRSTIRPVWYWKGREVPREDIVHIPWFAVPDHVLGLSPLAAFAATIGVGLAAQSYGATWFDNGGFPPGTFQNTAKTIPQDVADAAKTRVTAAIRGRQPLVYGADWKYDPISVPPNEAQFVETSRLSATQIANIYGLPPEDVGGSRGGSLTYSTVELNQLDRVAALRPWMVMLEQAFAAQLPEGQYVRFNADAIVRTDMKTRWEVHQLAVGMGARSIDEVRRLEDQPPLPDGQGATYQTPALTAAQQEPQQPPSNRAPERMWVIPA